MPSWTQAPELRRLLRRSLNVLLEPCRLAGDAAFRQGLVRGTTVSNPVVYLYPGLRQTVHPPVWMQTAMHISRFGGVALRPVLDAAAAEWLADHCKGSFAPCYCPHACWHLIAFSRKSDAAMFRLAFGDRIACARFGLLWVEPPPPVAVFMFRK